MGIEIIAGLLASGGLALTGGIAVDVGGIALSTIGAYALVGGAIVGGSILIRDLQPKQHVDNQQTVKQSTPARVRLYGRGLLAGSYFFFDATSKLVSGYVLCEGPIDAFEEHWFSGEIINNHGMSGDTETWPWTQDYGVVYFGAQLGTVDQTVNTTITDVFGYWDASHRLQGLANTVVVCELPGNPSKNFAKYYPSGVPSYLARVRGSLVFDPRDGSQAWNNPLSWKWSANPALCVLDYLTSSRGMHIPQSRMDLGSFSSMASLCDQEVALASGGGETRYVLWGTYSLDEQPADVLSRMLKTCDGEIYPLANGTLGMRGGQWSAPTVTITPDMILTCEAKRGVDKLDTFNQLRVRYTDISNQFQQMEGDPWDDVAAQEASGEVLPQDFDIVMVPSYTQGCRLAKIFMAKGNPEWLLTITTDLSGLNALGERTVHVAYPDLQIDQDFFVNGFEIVDAGTCKLTLGSLSADAYEWSTSEERNPAPPYVPGTPGPSVPQALSGLALTLGRVSVASGYAVFINVTATPPADISLQMVVQYQKDGDADWLDMTVDDVAYVASSGYLEDGAEYDVRAAFETYGGSVGPYTLGTIRAVADDIQPAVPTSFAMSLAAGVETLTWTNGNSANFSGVEVFHNTVNSFSTATLLKTVYGAPNAAGHTTATPVTGPNFYWIASINSSGVPSASVGPLSVTV